MDFMNAVMHHKVHFFTHTFLFWTSSVPYSTSTSNPSRCDLPFWTSSVPHSASTSNPSRCDLPFWTSPCHSSASTSNPPRFDFLFGLLRAIPPLQRPIHHALTSFLDFIRALLHFNVQSATLWLPFWTSSMPHSTSTSNPPRFSFTLHCASPSLRTLHHLSNILY